MTREEMWKEFENQLISETRTPITMSYDDAEILIKLGIKETVAKWKRRLEQTRWIPVSERLPKERVAVLVWCPERKNIYCACYEEKQWWIFGAYFNKVEFDVVAWMPLQEAWKESEDKE